MSVFLKPKLLTMKRFYSILIVSAVLLMSSHTFSQESRDYYIKAERHFQNARNDSALVYLDLALANSMDSTSRNGYKQMTEILLLRSRVYSNLAFFEPALENAIRSYNFSRKYSDKGLTTLSLVAIGKVHYYMYNDSLAEHYLVRAKEMAEDERLERELMVADNALAQLYSVLERNDECLDLATKSLEKSKQLKDTLYIVHNLNLFASYYTNLNRNTDPIIPEYQAKVKYYLDEAMRLVSIKNTHLLLLTIYANYVRYYRVEKDYAQALDYAYKVIEICGPTHYAMLIQIYDHLVGIYANMGDAKMTIYSHQRFYQLMKKQSDYTLHRTLQEMRVKHDVQEKELEIKHTRKHRLLMTFIAVSALLLGLLFYVMYYVRRKQNKRLHKLNATKDKLFSIISHDLKAPVAAQRIAVENMLENFDNYNPETLLKNLNEFHRASDMQLGLLENLLNWVRVQTGEMKYRPVALDLCQITRDVVRLYELPAQNKGVTLHIKTSGGCIVHADRQMIHTVLRNLLNNAVKFSNPNSEIFIEISTQEDKTVLRIKDQGIGISEERLKNLFELSSDKTTPGTHGEVGSGLGLVICKELLEQNGSSLFIQSVAGKGTEVGFEL